MKNINEYFNLNLNNNNVDVQTNISYAFYNDKSSNIQKSDVNISAGISEDSNPINSHIFEVSNNDMDVGNLTPNADNRNIVEIDKLENNYKTSYIQKSGVNIAANICPDNKLFINSYCTINNTNEYKSDNLENNDKIFKSLFVDPKTININNLGYKNENFSKNTLRNISVTNKKEVKNYTKNNNMINIKVANMINLDVNCYDKTSKIQPNIVNVGASVPQDVKLFNTDRNTIDVFLETFPVESMDKEGVIFENLNDELNVNEKKKNYYFDNNFNLDPLRNEDFGYQKQVTNYPQTVSGNQVSSNSKCFSDINLDKFELNKSAFHALSANDSNNIISNNLKNIAADVNTSFGDNQFFNSNLLAMICKDNNDMNYLTPNAFEESGNDVFIDWLIDNFDGIRTNHSITHKEQVVANIKMSLKKSISYKNEN